ncbi:aminopeptidase [Candidatus Borkfalkia ceftriaxoniphila]|uniref:Aminopeptidase n=1 Tax=Candidatus Borkfalkia ceftriaxoniphila TaxID=2508949 RepID=A0A4Q2K5D9_9FIRM|nr:aminopeptidase [Candidatus Borkfalkia ceftriaxoniphila]RXZ58029.1 aminopeptidase [Candidatus Borkfalkia ceftriaxoniphila]
MKKTVLKNYAKLIAKTGVNVKSGQDVIIRAELDQPEFVAYVAEECYRAGARNVRVEWSHQPVSRLNAIYQSEDTLAEVAPWQEEKLRDQSLSLPAVIYLESADPDGMNGVDAHKVSSASMRRFPKIKPYRDAMENKYQWCIAAVAGKNWAKKVFPKEKNAQAAEEKLWEAILRCSRAEGNPIGNWNEHNKNLSERCRILNGLHLKKLFYRSSNGTDLTVGLMPEGVFAGGGETTLSGRYFNPNIPSEEVFTTPRRGLAEGVVYSTKPLSYQGQLIENFHLRFADGKVTEAAAEKGEEVLKKMLAMDEGASYLGECALVPFDSPINESGLLFYNTLFDENASCHLALGRGFSMCVKGYENYSDEKIKELGVNDSMIHVDFMIGARDLSIEGETEDGARVPIFVNGNWAI